MDITKELISLIMGIVVLVAITSFFYSMYQPPVTGVGQEKYQASEDIGRAVSACCTKHAGSYRTYNDDCELFDVNITDGNVTKDMISWYVSEECEFELDEDITGEGKIKITYMGKERKVRITVINN